MFRRLARITVRHRWTVMLLWGVLAAASAPFGRNVHEALQPGGFSNARTEGAQALRLLHQELGAALSSVTVVFSHPERRVTDPDYAAEADRVLSALVTLPQARSVVGYATTGNPRFVSADGHTTYAGIGLDATTAEAQRLTPQLRALLPETWLQVWITGGPPAYADIELVSQRDLTRAESISLPLALVSLLVVFGGAVAAGLPVLVGGVAVVVTLAVVYGIGQVAEMSIFVQNLATMLGLGISIDYALLMVSRFREEMAADPEVEEALARTMETAGRAVFFSGLTVFLGLAGLLLFDYVMLRSIGVGGCLVVAMAVVAALTLLPALLAIIGRRIDAFPLPLAAGLARRLHNGQGGGPWARVAQAVGRRPLLVFAATLVLLASFGAPFLRVRMGAPDVTVLPSSVESRQGFDILRGQFGAGEVAPNLVVVEADGPVLAPERLGALYDYVRALERLPGVVRTESIVSLDPAMGKAQYQFLYSQPEAITDPNVRAQLDLLARGRVALVSVVSGYNPASEEARALVRAIRAVDPGPGLRSYVGGAAAELMDVVQDLYTVFPRTLLLVVVSTYLALLVLFRSVVLPAKAVVMDTLSILASYGALVLIFQDGHLAGLLNFTPEGTVDATVPIVMFSVLFGLSMDYEVFMLSRVKEAYDRTGDNAAAVAEGLQRTGGIITSAALIIVIVAGSFAFADIVVVKALGVGMALAILLDATIVRALLVPSTMHLLGRANWWAPRWLRGRIPERAATRP